MPRVARVKSESGIYHIMLRGINQQTIFEQDEDYEKFIETIEKIAPFGAFSLNILKKY